MANFYVGNFVKKHSTIHTLDPRLKIVYVIIISCLVFAERKLPGILFVSIAILFLLSLSRMPLHYTFKNIKRFFLLFFFIFCMYLIFSHNKLGDGILVIWRFLMFVLLSLTLTYTTSLSDLTIAIEKLSKPLKLFGIKPRNIAVMLFISIRFLPVMFIRFERLREAMLARLADFRKPAAIKILILSLLESIFASAATLSDAMIARLYNEDVESSVRMKFKRKDYYSLGVFITVFIILLLLL